MNNLFESPDKYTSEEDKARAKRANDQLLYILNKGSVEERQAVIVKGKLLLEKAARLHRPVTLEDIEEMVFGKSGGK
jgi:hypothetical protein